jgi:protein transport protein SEC13
MASTAPSTFDAQHEAQIHDAKFDYYGKRLATCSADGAVNIFNVVENEAPVKTGVIRLHKNAVFQVAWAHPRFGSLLASCGYDGRVYVAKEVT